MNKGRLKNYFQTTFLYKRCTGIHGNCIFILSDKVPLLRLLVNLPAVDREEVGAEPPFVYRLIIDIGVWFG